MGSVSFGVPPVVACNERGNQQATNITWASDSRHCITPPISKVTYIGIVKITISAA